MTTLNKAMNGLQVDSVAMTAAPLERPSPVKILTTHAHELPAELLRSTSFLQTGKVWQGTRPAGIFKKSNLLRRALELRRAWKLFRQAPNFDAVITVGSLEGLAFAALQNLRRRRPVHVMYDCYWYAGNILRNAWMRFCLRQVDCCAVWASVEGERYAKAFGLARSKFRFVAHHHSLNDYAYQIADRGYVFTGGNSDRDYGFFFQAMRDLPVKCILATNRVDLLAGMDVPAHIQIVSVSATEFRQLMAEARVVVMPVRADLLRTAGQQSILNAMYMGKAVILTDPEGGRDYIEHGKTGLLVSQGDVDGLRAAIKELWEQPDKARAMGDQARAAAAKLTTERCNTEIWQLALGLSALRSNSRRTIATLAPSAPTEANVSTEQP